ncbi:hypothetical protein KDJ56_10645 [Brevibacillus composti]|uniref:Uncharacterized protein n=1 Tax=Brevibacillus composti TaxID=2796470 RepID=A0A7T5JQK2_9BACL|nr:hypothetical protein [Brevibacillus composti]QQE76337.1 hypothetical protein JD108_10960 [Brevibacillus composti]QUO43364.1 hypothetical protein KDJ56_10645 [Brevibacillus composti]
MKNMYKLLIFSLVIHLLVLLCIYAVEKYEESKVIQELNMEYVATQKENPEAYVVYFFFSSPEDEKEIYTYFVITIPAAMGMFVLFRKLRQL